MASSDHYRHRFGDGGVAPWPTGKVLCVGRNYAAHAHELNNPLPEEPLLFIKPATAVTAFTGTLALAAELGVHHYETEMTVLIGKPLSRATRQQAGEAIAGLGVGLDLTLRTQQDDLKAKRYPWELAKAFDGSCVLSAFTPCSPAVDIQDLDVRLWRNGELVQAGNTGQMLFPVLALLERMSRYFTLLPGDVVMTGTPKGVGELRNGDTLRAELGTLVAAQASVTYV
jgi:2-keto-4-pentenoate hydratase/2-oxohepta-3-ene-1,7-dioic acid hydratase in catechol pathway